MTIRGTNGGLSDISTDGVLQSLFGPGVSERSYLPNIGTSDAPIQGQNGFINDFRELDTSTPLVFGQLVATLIHSPNLFNLFGDVVEQTLTNFLKFLVESHPTAITGVDLEFTMESAGGQSGQDGQEYQVPKENKITQPSPSFTWKELAGNSIFNFVRSWMSMARDHRTQTSSKNYNRFGTNIDPDDPRLYTPLVSSDTSMTVLFTQYGSSGDVNDIIDAYIITNMYPNGTGPAGFQRELGVSVMPERNITFTGIIEHSPAIFAFAKRVHEAKYTDNAIGSNEYHSYVNEDRQSYLASGLANTPG